MAARRERIDYGPPRPPGGGGQIAAGVIPAGVKMVWPGKGALVFTSMMSGHDDDPGAQQRIPVEVDREMSIMFHQIEMFMDATGGGVGSITNLTFFVMDNPAVGPPGPYEELIHKEMAKMFPAPAHQPAHHILNVAPAGLRGERVEVVVAAHVT